MKKFYCSWLFIVSSLYIFAQNGNEKLLLLAYRDYQKGDFISAYSLFSQLDSICPLEYYNDLWKYYVSAEKLQDTAMARSLLYRIARSNGVEISSFQQSFFDEVGLFNRPYWPSIDSLISIAENSRCHPFIDSLEFMASADQAIRKEDLTQAEMWRRMSVIDSTNTSKLISLIEKYGFPTWDLVGRKASRNAWLIAQHSQALITWYLGEYKKAVEENNAEKKLLAYMEDRYLTSEGRPQLYGTQFYTRQIDSIKGIFPVADIKRLNDRRCSMDLLPIEQTVEWNWAGTKGLDRDFIDYLAYYYPNNTNMYIIINSWKHNRQPPDSCIFYWNQEYYSFPCDLEVLSEYIFGFHADTAEAVVQAKKMVLCGQRLEDEWYLPKVLMDSVDVVYNELRADYERLMTKDADSMLLAITSFDTLSNVLDTGYYPRYTIEAWNWHIKDIISNKAKTLEDNDYEVFFAWLFEHVKSGNYHLFDYAELYDKVYYRLFGKLYYGQIELVEVPIFEIERLEERRKEICLPPMDVWKECRQWMRLKTKK